MSQSKRSEVNIYHENNEQKISSNEKEKRILERWEIEQLIKKAGSDHIKNLLINMNEQQRENFINIVGLDCVSEGLAHQLDRESMIAYLNAEDIRALIIAAKDLDVVNPVCDLLVDAGHGETFLKQYIVDDERLSSTEDRHSPALTFSPSSLPVVQSFDNHMLPVCIDSQGHNRGSSKKK
jgi:hypothetical protein